MLLQSLRRWVTTKEVRNDCRYYLRFIMCNVCRIRTRNKEAEMLTDITAAYLYWRMMRIMTEARLAEYQRIENERLQARVHAWTERRAK